MSWFLYQCVEAGYCEWADLSNGKYTIRDVLDMNEMIAEKAEYERRGQDAAEEKHGRG